MASSVNAPGGGAGTNTSSQSDATSNNASFYRLKVEDALSYLDQVKLQFESQPHVYNHFLDIMKEFKSQTIDTPGVISRVSNLFRGHTDLIEGFNTFLPPGYKIEVQENNSVHFTAPNSTLSTLVTPLSTGISGFMPTPPNNQPNTISSSSTNSNNNTNNNTGNMNSTNENINSNSDTHDNINNNATSAVATSAQQLQQQQRQSTTTPTVQLTSTGPGGIPTLVNLTPANVIKNDGQQLKGEPLLLTSFLPGTNSNTSANSNKNKIPNLGQSNNSNSLSVKILPTSTTIGGTLVTGTGMVQPINISSSTPPPLSTTAPQQPKPNLSVNSLTAASSDNQPPNSNSQQQPQSQVEFGHAINYVNKIKSRFSNQPDIYKSFLEILHTYQKQQKNLKEGVTTGTQNFLSESEVYAKVAKLFKNQEDLLVEFSQFLPDASGGGSSSGNTTGNPLNVANNQQVLLGGHTLQLAQTQQTLQQSHLIQDSQMSNIIASNLSEFTSQFAGQQIPYLQQSVLNVPIPISQLQFNQSQQQQQASTSSNKSAGTPSKDKQSNQQQQQAAGSKGPKSENISAMNQQQQQQANSQFNSNSQQQSQPMATINQNLNKGGNSNSQGGFKETAPYKRISQYQQMSTKKQKISSMVNNNNNNMGVNPTNKQEPMSNKINSKAMNNQNYNQFNGPNDFQQQQNFQVAENANSGSHSKPQHATLNEVTFFERLKKALRTQQVYDNFLKCLALFNQDIVTRSELIALVEPFLGKFANLYRWFKDYVENKPMNSMLFENNADMKCSGKSRGEYMPTGNNYSLEIDYLSCKQYGASYRDISSYPQPISTGQTELCKQVLNNIYVSFPSWSEDSTFISSKKNQYEELIFRIEDERFELDVVLETNLSTIRVLENVQAKMSQMNADELNKYRLNNTLGGTSETVHVKTIQRVYGDKAKDFIDGLKRNPSVAVPLVLKRLKAKDEEWREAKKALEKQWSEQIERNYLKSLDHCAVPFKQNDQKQLKAKSLINEIEEAKEDILTAAVAPSSTSMGSNGSNTAGTTLLDQQQQQAKPTSFHQPHITIKYEDKSILDDAAALVIHHVKRQTTIQREDKHRIKEIVYHFLPDLLYVQRGALSDDESSPDPPQAHSSNENEDGATHDEGGANPVKKLRSAATGRNMHTDANKRRLTDSDSEKPGSTGGNSVGKETEGSHGSSEYRSPEDMYRLYFVDNHWYLFFRYHHILCERLYKIYKHSVQIAEQCSEDSKAREQSVAEALKLRNKSEVSPDDYYPAFLDIVRNLLDGNMESNQYEDTLREMFGIHAYIAFTLDKVVHNCVRQLQHLVQNEVSSSLKQIYGDEIRANTLLSSSLGGASCLPSIIPSLGTPTTSGGGCGGKVSNMSYSSVINAELAYQKKVESLLTSQKLFKIISYKNSCRLTIELLETDEDDEEDEDNEEISEIEKWSEYVEKYCSAEEHTLSDELKARLTNRVPVFLTKNAHVLKVKHENALEAKKARKEAEEASKKKVKSEKTDTEADDVKREKGEEEKADKEKGEVAGVDKAAARDVMDDVAMRDDTVYKFQANSYKLVYGANSTSVMYRKNAFRNAKKSHHSVTKKMFSRFRQFSNRWLKENGTSPDCIDDMLLGEHLEPSIKTICVKESYLKRTPYHVYYRYKVIDDSKEKAPQQQQSKSSTDETATSKAKGELAETKMETSASVEIKPEVSDSGESNKNSESKNNNKSSIKS